MRQLLIFDGSLDMSSTEGLFDRSNMRDISLFSLAGDVSISDRIEKLLIERSCSAERLDSVGMLEREVAVLQRDIPCWSAKIGDTIMRGRSVKEWLKLPGHEVSAWWFGIISEKSPLKTDIFLNIAQIRAIKRLISSGRYGRCLVAISNKKVERAVKAVARRHAIGVKIIRTSRRRNRRVDLKSWLRGLGVVRDISYALAYAVRCYLHGIMARDNMRPIGERMPKKGSTMFVTYFPAFDKDAAKTGIFRNKYTPGLQQIVEEMDGNLIWLLMYAPALNDYSYTDAVNIARGFSNKGQKLFFIEEFFTFRAFLSSMKFWFRQLVVSRYLLNSINKRSLVSEPVTEECLHVVEELWKKSFYGSEGMSGIIYYLMFVEMFKRVFEIKDCLYYWEMQAWEKALNAAKDNCTAHIRTIGFQHTSFSKNEIQYICDRSELDGDSAVTDLPRPDVLACNGELACSYFSGIGYEGVSHVEAIRHMYIERLLSQERPSSFKAGKPLLLVTGSINRNETLNMISMVHAAFPKAEKIDIWFKGHPCLPMDLLFKELGLDSGAAEYRMITTDISECLKSSWAVIVPTSTVAIEALAFGCEVIVPVFPDSINTNPLAGYEDFYHKASSVEELRKIFDKISHGFKLQDIEGYHEFIRKYWYLDADLPRWRDLLNDRNVNDGAGLKDLSNAANIQDKIGI